MTIGERLKEERNRVGANQTVFAAQCGVTKNTQLAYEKDERSPDANYLAAASAAGIDVLYVVTGERKPEAANSFAGDEVALVSHYRQLPADQRAHTVTMVSALAEMAGRYEVKK